MSCMGCGMRTCTKLYTNLHPSLVAMPLQAPKTHQSPLLRDGAGHMTQVDMCVAEIVIQANTQHSKPRGQGLMPQIGQVDLP